MLHRVWAISEPSALNEIRQVMANGWALIADGHHRYETCLDYQQMMRQSIPHTTGDEWFNFAMMYLTDIHDPGLTILPTHRVLRGLSPAFVKQLPACLRDTCDLEAFPCHTPAEQEAQRQRLMDEMRRCGPSTHVFGLYTGEETFWLLTYRGSLATQAPTAGCNADAQSLTSACYMICCWRRCWGSIREDTIAFTQDDAAAVDLVARQEYQGGVPAESDTQWNRLSSRHGRKAHAAQIDLFLSKIAHRHRHAQGGGRCGLQRLNSSPAQSLPPNIQPTLGPEVAFVGRSNVGKSSLINTLLNRRGLAKTSSTPGKTRTINFFRINGKFGFVDLPGYGFAQVSRAERAAWGPMVAQFFQTRQELEGWCS